MPAIRERSARLEVLLELLPERLLRGRLAVVDERADRLAELVEGDGADRRVPFRDLVAVDPKGDLVLIVRVEREELLAGDLIDLLALRVRRTRRHQTEQRADGDGADEP